MLKKAQALISQYISYKDTMKRKSKESDVTSAFIKTADDYILLAENIDEARNRAFIAVLAWNISLYPKEQIAERIRLLALEYEKNNPGIVKAEYLSHDLQILVDHGKFMLPLYRGGTVIIPRNFQII
ncbi:MAG: hypothetical protein VR65_23835 [Desulfobulbaceae bacterium BRH_c16a]|nr:MAG: hypothetical protein VR65_23835 [Desulfobulbaceae bacterium BRH_c16a]